jgi:cytidylate kinase
MYRAVTLYFLDQHIALTDQKEIGKALLKIRITFHVSGDGITETFLNGLNVERKIRKMRISENVSQVSTIKEVRMAMVDQQRKLGKDKRIVMDGRDIGSVVFPDAELKLFLTADILVRAFRRQRELLEKDDLVDLDTIIANLQKRDEIDSHRKESPLVRAKDAIVMDTTHITIDEQVDEVVRLALGCIVQGQGKKIY